MNDKISKIGMLAALLAVPILIYAILQLTGKNHYKVMTYYPLEVVTTEVKGKFTYDTIFYQLPDFGLIDDNGDSVNLKRFENKVLVANFFFTRCGGICPKIMSNLTLVQEAYYKTNELNILSITVDPEYDKGEILTNYGKKLNIDPNKWILCTGKPIDIYNLGFYGFKLPADTVDKTLHSEKVVLLDRKRHIRGYYTGTDKKEIERLITEANILISQNE
jgi:protein SCO1/2